MMRVVCTAGHVDSGKSTLVRALTGMEPDRFAEERRRGLTIDLGFAWTELAGPAGPATTVAFVDVPGHERFLPNMLAGAGAVDHTLFVVAADEGWKPQSQEHLDILGLLGVRHGLVALTKSDLVDGAALSTVRADVRRRLAGTGLADSMMVAVSAVTGSGLAQLRAELLRLLAACPPPSDTGRPRLWVDRSFSVRGAGTVVTGTLAGGTLQPGMDLAVLPAGRRARIRGLQALNRPVTTAAPGSRVAVNLANVEREDVGRGDALGIAGQWLAVTAFDAQVRTLGGFEIGRKGAWHVHAGSGEHLARLTPLLGEPVHDEGYVRVELSSAAPLTAGDRFVLREAGRRATLGGGVVLDVDPPAVSGAGQRRLRAQALDRRARALNAGDRSDLLALHVSERGAADAASAAAAIGLPPRSLGDAAGIRGLLRLGQALAHPQAAATWSGAVAQALRRYHEAHPLERAAPKDVALRAATTAGCPSQLAPALLETLAGLGRVVADGPGLRDPRHRVRLDPAQQDARDALLAALSGEPFSPPGIAAAAARAKASPALLRELEAAGDIVRLGPDLAFAAEALPDALARLRAAVAAEGPLTAARAKQVLGTSRKYALPLLEELDRRGLTRRTGDVRTVV